MLKGMPFFNIAEDVYFFAFPIGFDLGKQTPLTVRLGQVWTTKLWI